MRKLFSALVLGALAFGFVPGNAADASGSILLPTAGTARLQRCKDVHGIENGTFGWVTNVNDGIAFTLTAVGGDDVNDFDIAFYTSLTPCAEDAAPPANDYTSVEGDEAGTVPAGATKAIITLFVGVPGSEFVYNEG